MIECAYQFIINHGPFSNLSHQAQVPFLKFWVFCPIWRVQIFVRWHPRGLFFKAESFELLSEVIIRICSKNKVHLNKNFSENVHCIGDEK